MRKTDEQRFRENVRLDKSTGCWLWTDRVDHRGYGRFYSRSLKREIPAHYYTLIKAGRPVPKDKETHHSCGMRNCVNPDHIKTLTHAAHMALHAESGIWRGEKNSQAKRTELDIYVIMFLTRVIPVPAKNLAKAMNIPLRSIYAIRNRECWSYLPLPNTFQGWGNLLYG